MLTGDLRRSRQHDDAMPSERTCAGGRLRSLAMQSRPGPCWTRHGFRRTLLCSVPRCTWQGGQGGGCHRECIQEWARWDMVWGNGDGAYRAVMDELVMRGSCCCCCCCCCWPMATHMDSSITGKRRMDSAACTGFDGRKRKGGEEQLDRRARGSV